MEIIIITVKIASQLELSQQFCRIEQHDGRDQAQTPLPSKGTSDGLTTKPLCLR